MTPIQPYSTGSNNLAATSSSPAESSAPFSSRINPLDSTGHPPLDGRAEFARQWENSLLCAIIRQTFEWIYLTFFAPPAAPVVINNMESNRYEEYYVMEECQSLEEAYTEACRILEINEETQHLWSTKTRLHPKTNAPFGHTFTNQETMDKFEVRYHGHPSVRAYILSPINS